MKREHLHHFTTDVLEPKAPPVKGKKNLRARILDGALRTFTRKPRPLDSDTLPGFRQAGNLPGVLSAGESQKAKILTITALIAANMFALILFVLLLYIL